MHSNIRLRRTRQHKWIRNLVAENTLSVNDLVWPVFVEEGKNITTPIPTMTGVERYSIDIIISKIKIAASLGINAIAIFPVVQQNLKSDDAKEAYNPDSLMCKAIKEIKNAVPEIGIIADVALDPYSSHGHDGIVRDGYVANDETVDILCRQAIVQAEAGADIIAPSDMMDGRVGAIRNALDKENFINTQILSYAAKYASSFYGPFREAVDSRSNLGKEGKQTYQMDYANSSEAICEVEQDILEGADMVMVKPALAYLDIIKSINDHFNVPIFAYQVSGEYAMIKAASDNGAFNYESAMHESLMSCKRAGARAIFTYSALEMADFING